MHRRFAVFAALLTGAFAGVAALPFVSARLHRPAEPASLFAADAQAALAAPSTGEALKQAGFTELIVTVLGPQAPDHAAAAGERLLERLRQ